MFQSNVNENIRPVTAKNNNSPKVAWKTDSSKHKKKGKCHAIIKDFLENTSLHGLKYIGFTRFTLFER